MSTKSYYTAVSMISYLENLDMKKTYYDKMHRANYLFNDLEMLYHQAARKLGVTDSVLCVLYVIHEKGEPCLLHDVCMESGISKQTINSAIRKMEKEGILYLESCKGKAKQICLTDKGRIYVKETAARVFGAECDAFADWSEEEIEQYLYLIEKYNASFRKQIEMMKEREV